MKRKQFKVQSSKFRVVPVPVTLSVVEGLSAHITKLLTNK